MTELDKLRDGYIAWMRYQSHPDGATSIHVCDSDHPKAFRVWKDVPALLDRIEELERGEGYVRMMDDEATMASLVVRIQSAEAELAEARKEAGKWRSDHDRAEAELSAEREAHAKTRSAYADLVAAHDDSIHAEELISELTDELRVQRQRADRAEADLQIERANQRSVYAALDRGIAEQRDAEKRMDRAEAVVRGLRAWLPTAFADEIRAHDIAFIERDFTVVRVRRGRANLLEDVLAKLDELEGR